MRAGRAAGVTLAALLLALVAVGCGAAGAGPDTARTPPTVRTDAGPPALGLAETLLGRVDHRAAWNFGEGLRASCMAAERFRYTRLVWRPDQQHGLGLASSLPERRQRGFGIAGTQDGGVLQPDPNGPLLSAMSDAARTRWFGRLSQCTNLADAEVNRRQTELTAALTTADRRYVTRALDVTDPRLQQAVREWAACMGRQRLQYRDPTTMLAALQQEFTAVGGHDAAALARFKVKEIRVALADYACSQQYIEPVSKRIIAELAGRLGDRYGVTSLYADEWHLKRPA